ncbi:unnamed protein product, partial [Symbiodinium necroappetens]
MQLPPGFSMVLQPHLIQRARRNCRCPGTPLRRHGIQSMARWSSDLHSATHSIFAATAHGGLET